MPDLKEEIIAAKEWQRQRIELREERQRMRKQWEREERMQRLGDRIEAMLAKFRLGGGCSQCSDLKEVLNHRGPDWMEENIDWVADIIEENAKKHPKIMARLAGRLSEKSITIREFLQKRLLAKAGEQREDDEWIPFIE